MPLPPTARIPAALTPLVGRERCLDDLAQLLALGRLLTLVGPGGIGKTRLAAATAEVVAQRGLPVAWIDLVAITDPTLVPLHVAATLGVREDTEGAVVERIAEALNCDGLVVLDNCEHVVGACAELADALLRCCANVRILATSRQPLGVPGEKAWLVPPLEVPSTDDEGAERAGAVALFVQRAGDALPSFALTPANRAAIARIVRRLDGMPLAIELAAARTRLLPPEQLERRLDDAFSLLTTSAPGVNPRHRTLRALIDWSYALLEPDERTLFDRLAVFAGSFSLDALEAVAADERLEAGCVLEALGGLVDKSLVHVQEQGGEARYALRETVRQYAAERFALAAGEEPRSGPHAIAALAGAAGVPAAEGTGAPPAPAIAALRDRHARHYLALAERAAPELHAQHQLEWLARLQADHDNLRAALRWCLDRRDVARARRLGVALRDFWRIRGHLTEGRRWLDETLALDGPDDGAKARVLVFSAVLGRMQGDHATFARLVRAGEAIARRVGDHAALADALTQLGVDLRDTRQVDAARAALDEAIALWRPLGDPWGLSNALAVRASIALEGLDFATARALRLEGVEVSRRAGDREGEGRGLVGLGEVARLEGDYAGADAYYERALERFRELGDSWHCAAVLHNQGWALAELGRHPEAQLAFEESLHLFTLAGNRVGVALIVAGFARILAERGDAESAAVALAMSRARFETQRLGPASADKRSWDRTGALIAAALEPDRQEALERRGAILSDTEALAWITERLRQSAAALRTSGSFPCPTGPGAPAPRPSRPSTADLRVHTLGRLEVIRAGTRLEDADFGGPKPRELLFLLLAHPRGRTREQVGVAFWPDSSPAQVKNRFHVTLHRLRKALGDGDWIATDGERYLVDPTRAVEFDAQLFEEGVGAALKSRAPADDRLAQLGNALGLYRGDFLDGAAVGDWHLDIRDRLQLLYLDGRLAEGALRAAAGDHARAAAAYRAVLAQDPLHEDAARRLMTALEHSGERAQALQQYRELSARLERELGVEPDDRTTALYERLRAG